MDLFLELVPELFLALCLVGVVGCFARFALQFLNSAV